MRWHDILLAHTQNNNARGGKKKHLVGNGVGARCGANDVVESEGYGGVFHDVTSVDDVGARGRDLNLDLITNTCRLGQQAHLGQQPGDSLGWFAVRRKQNNDCY